jgi:Tfp pilus assembly protein PilV
MMNHGSGKISRLIRSEAGLTLLETLIAAVILLFVLLSMVSAYRLGRINIDREEVKRKATAVAQDRLETLKSRYAHNFDQDGWTDIWPSEIDTTYVVDGTTFTVTSIVTSNVAGGAEFGGRKTINLDVSWTAMRNNNTSVVRSIRATTDITRIIPFGTE